MRQQNLSEYEESLIFIEKITKKKTLSLRLGLISFYMSSRGIALWGTFFVLGTQYCTPPWSDNCSINPSVVGIILIGGIAIAILSIRLIFSGFALNKKNKRFQSVLGIGLLISICLICGNIVLMYSIETNRAVGLHVVEGTLNFIFESFSIIVRGLLHLLGINTGGTGQGGGGWNIIPG